MKHIAIIPARAGSKSIINKNLQKIKNKSLVDWAVSSAISAGIFEDIYLTTDIPDVIASYDKHPSITLIKRKDTLATDEAMMADVVGDILGGAPISPNDFFWLLQPTSPFRMQSDYKDICEILARKQPMSVISVKDVGPNHPDRCYTIPRGLLKEFQYSNFRAKQGLLKTYIRNGCFYVCQVAAFRRLRTFYLEDCCPYIMPEERSINIDGPLDLMLAQAVGNKMICEK